MTGKVRAELARHRLATGRGGDDLVFGRTAADAFVRSTVRARAIKAWAESGAVTPHEARHCAASYFAQAGCRSRRRRRRSATPTRGRRWRSTSTRWAPGWQEQATSAKLDAYLGISRAGRSRAAFESP
jgi:hypothetical protein